MRFTTAFVFLSGLLLGSCTVSKKIGQSAHTLVTDGSLQTAHVGISIYEPATGKWWYNWQGDKYFVPASNTKLATCYAAMKYLGDSLVGFVWDTYKDTTLIIKPAGDPTFLHPDFNSQHALAFLKRFKKIEIFQPSTSTYTPAYGSGWAWNDYLEPYMPYPSQFPVYGNLASFRLIGDSVAVMPAALNASFKRYKLQGHGFEVRRRFSSNEFWSFDGSNQTQQVPFYPDMFTAARMINDTTGVTTKPEYLLALFSQAKKFYSQPTDSLLKITMHRSDNFFAEQTLLMVSNEVLGYMSDERIIDTLLKTIYAGLPQKPRWVDGSGLSRYNLFTPQDFVTILGKMKKDFGMRRIKEILPTGNEGTLRNYYTTDSTALYAKTGTLSGVVALSGFLTTKKRKELIFSVLVNNHNSSATQVRRAVEKFIQNLRNRY